MDPRALTIVLSCAALLLACTATARAAKTTVEEACRDAAAAHPDISYDHCVSSLASDRRVRRDAVDLHDLAVVATKIAIEHAASTESKIDDITEAEASPEARARLEHCLEVYSAAANVLRDALDNLHAQVYSKAGDQLAAALGASESCEEAWKGHEGAPVASHDKEYGRMAMVALGLTSGI